MLAQATLLFKPLNASLHRAGVVMNFQKDDSRRQPCLRSCSHIQYFSAVLRCLFQNCAVFAQNNSIRVLGRTPALFDGGFSAAAALKSPVYSAMDHFTDFLAPRFASKKEKAMTDTQPCRYFRPGELTGGLSIWLQKKKKPFEYTAVWDVSGQVGS